MALDLRALTRVPLTNTQNLLTDNAVSTPVAPVDALVVNAQSLLDQVKAELNLTQGEITMLIPDMPNVPPQNVPVLIAQANQAQTGTATQVRVLGVCSPSPSNKYSAENGLVPIASAQIYFDSFENRDVSGPASTTILQQPKHGVLRLITEADAGSFGKGRFVAANQLYVYLPEHGYVGTDTGSILVDFGGGNKVEVRYFFQAIEGTLGNTGLETLCSDTGVYWKISSTLDANGTNIITSVEYQSPTTSTTGEKQMGTDLFIPLANKECYERLTRRLNALLSGESAKFSPSSFNASLADFPNTRGSAWILGGGAATCTLT